LQTGTKISGTAHLVLVGVAIFGGTFSSDPLPLEVREVSVISAEQFAAMTAPRQPPDIAGEPVALSQPTPDTDTPDIAAEQDADPQQNPPEPAALSEPELEAPEVAPQDISPPPQQRPIDRVAPVPVVAPPPDVAKDDVETPQVKPDEQGETPKDPTEAAAPEEAADRIVTEAEKPVSEPITRSPRPPARPTNLSTARREPTPKPTPPPSQTPQQASQQASQTAVNDALAEALNTSTPVPTGPPLTGGEKDALRIAVSNCWNVGSLSSAALQTTVVVGVAMAPDGKPQTSSIRMLSSSGGPDAAAKQAFEAARRAIIRCGAKGYDLPAEKYGQWQQVEMTFNPERMRIK
jgi:hypothetical protein